MDRLVPRWFQTANRRWRSGTSVSPVRFDSHKRDACATIRFMEIAVASRKFRVAG